MLNCSKNSLNALKKRIAARSSSTGETTPFFNIDVQLSVPSVNLSPKLDEIQKSINKAAQVGPEKMREEERGGERRRVDERSEVTR